MKVPQFVEYVMEDSVPIPPIAKRVGQLADALRRIQPNQSFVTAKPSSTINNIARGLGIKVVARIANPDEKDPKKRLNRVWRVDGTPMEKLATRYALRNNPTAPKPKSAVQGLEDGQETS